MLTKPISPPEDTNLNVIYNVNDIYAPYLPVNIYSLCENNQIHKHINVYVFSSVNEKISNKNKDLINLLTKRFGNLNIEYIEIDPEKLIATGVPIHHGSYTTYLKFYAERLLPYADRVLYIDVDAFVFGDITQFYNLDFKDNLIAGAEDFYFSRDHFPESEFLTRKTIDSFSKESGGYINCGLVLFNLDGMREENNGTDFLMNIAREYKDYTLCFDQDLLNIAFNNRVTKVDKKYGYHYMIPYENRLRDFVKQNRIPSVLHACGAPKPWQYPNWFVVGKEFWYYYDSFEKNIGKLPFGKPNWIKSKLFGWKRKIWSIFLPYRFVLFLQMIKPQE
jgi:lipopolysaccharide biosynthesis glycosyltransferase